MFLTMSISKKKWITHHIEVFENGEKRYYVTKDSIDDIEKLTKSSDQTTSLGTLSKPNNIKTMLLQISIPTNITKDIPVDLERLLSAYPNY